MSARNAYPVAIASVANVVCALMLQRWKTKNKKTKVAATGILLVAFQAFATVVASTRQANNTGDVIVIVISCLAAIGFLWPFAAHLAQLKLSAQGPKNNAAKVKLLGSTDASNGF